MKRLQWIAALLLLGSTGLFAGGTTAGTQIDNSATLSYTAGGGTAETVNSNTDTFLVDKKIDFTVTNDDGDQVPVLAGAQDQNTTWTVANTGNADQNFTLSSSNLPDGSKIYGNEDNEDTGLQSIYYSTDGGTTWTQYNGKIVIAKDANISVRVASDIPAGQQENGKVMNIALKATAVKANGTTENATSGADHKNAVDTVLADGHGTDDNNHNTKDGDGHTDNDHDAIYIAWGGYIVRTPVLVLTKKSCVYSDPINGTNDPKRIPGATILYVFDLNNTGSADASGITLKDSLPTYLDGSTLKSGKNQTAGKVTVNSNTNDCTCSDGALQTNGSDSDDQDADPQKVEVQNISVQKSKVTCVSFTVDIQ
jgi:uncharacterized repeat protein (TIGR01451 family)